MDSSKNTALEFHDSSEETLWDVEGQIGQAPTSAATLDVEEDKEGMHTFSKFPDSAVDEENEDESDTTGLINDQQKKPLWSFAYYQQFFDVDTATVMNRIKGSMIPLPNRSFNRTYVKGKPDIYGPFWICATLVLSIGVCGNLANLFNNMSNPNYKYRPQFQLLPIAATIIYCYAFILPVFIKCFFWWRKTSGLAVSQIICIYGYSLFIFIPASMLFMVPYEVFSWIVVAIAICLSGAVVLISLWPALQNDSKKLGIIILLILFAIHATVMVCLRLYFFSSPYTGHGNESLTTTAQALSHQATSRSVSESAS